MLSGLNLIAAKRIVVLLKSSDRKIIYDLVLSASGFYHWGISIDPCRADKSKIFINTV